MRAIRTQQNQTLDNLHWIADIAIGWITVNIIFSLELLTHIKGFYLNHNVTEETRLLNAMQRISLQKMYSRLELRMVIIINLCILMAALISTFVYVVNLKVFAISQYGLLKKIIMGKNSLRLTRILKSIILQLVLFLLLNSFSCKEEQLEVTMSLDTSNVIAGKSSIANSFEIGEVNLLKLNPNIECASFSHYFIVITNFTSILFFIISDKLQLQVDRITLSNERFSIINPTSHYTSQIFQSIIFLINNIGFSLDSELKDDIRSIVLIETVMIIISCYLVHVIRPNYNKRISKSVQVQQMILCSIIVPIMILLFVVERRALLNRNVPWIVYLLIMSIFIKMHGNIGSLSNSSNNILRSIQGDKITRHSVLLLYSEAIQYFEEYQVLNRFNALEQLDDSNVFWIQVFMILNNQNTLSINSNLENNLNKHNFIAKTYHELILKAVVIEIDRILSRFIKSNPDDKEMFIIYLNFLLEARGNFTKAFWYLFAKERANRSVNFTNIEKALLLDKLNHITIAHLTDCRFIKLYEGKEIKANHKQNAVFINLIKFIDLFEHCKLGVKLSIEQLISMLSELNKSGDIKKVHEKIYKCYDSKIKTEEELQTLYNATAHRFSPLSKLQIFYYRFVDYNVKEAKKYLQRIQSYNSLLNINIFSEKGDCSERIIIIISGEGTDFQRIKAVYGNLELINQTISNLLDHDLSKLLPNVFKDCHSSFIKKDNSFDSLLESDDLQYTYAYGIDGFTTRVQLKLKIYYNYESGVRYFGFLTPIHTSELSEMAAIVDQIGIVKDVTRNLSSYIKPGQELRELNIKLSREILVIGKVITSYINLTPKEILKTTELRESWRIYLELVEGKKFNIYQGKGINKTTIRVNVAVEEFLFQRVNFVWIVKFSFSDIMDDCNRRINPPFISGPLLDELQFFFKEFKKEASIRDSPMFSSVCSEGSEKITPTFTISPRKLKEENIEKIAKSFSCEPAFDILLKTTNKIEDDSLDAQSKFGSFFGIARATLAAMSGNKLTKKNNKVSSPSQGYKNASSNSYTFKSDLKHKKIELVKEGQGQNAISDSFLDKEGGNTESNNLEINKRINISDLRRRLNLKGEFQMRIISSFGMFLLFISLIYFQLKREFIFESSNLEIIEKIPTIDLFRLQTISTVYSTFYLEVCRLTISKELPDDFLSPLASNISMSALCTEQLKKTGSSQLSISLQIEDQLNRIVFPSLFDNLENMRNINLSLETYSTNIDGNREWKYVSYPRQAAISSISGFSTRFLKRDYKQSSNIPMFSIALNQRSEDFEEEEYRRNLLGSLDLHFTFRAREFNKYILAVPKYNRTTIEIELLSSIALTLLSIGVLTFLFYLEIHKARNFYELLFQIKKSELEIEIKTLKKHSYEIEHLLENGDDNHIGVIDKENRRRKHRRLSSNTQSKKITSKNMKSMFSLNVEVIHKRFSFGYIRSLSYILIIFATFILSKIASFIIYQGRNSRLLSLTSIYTLNAETWITLSQLHNSAIETMLWNNTLLIWGKPSLTIFEELSMYLEGQIFPNLTNAISYDLGNLSSTFRSDLMLRKTCGYIIFKDELEKCPFVYDGILNSNLLGIYKEMLLTLKTMLAKWKDARDSWNRVKAILESSIMRSIWGYYFLISNQIYFFFAEKAFNTIVGEISENLQFIERIRYYGEILLILWILILATIILRSLKSYNQMRKKAIKVTPFNLWKHNFKLNKFLFK